MLIIYITLLTTLSLTLCPYAFVEGSIRTIIARRFSSVVIKASRKGVSVTPRIVRRIAKHDKRGLYINNRCKVSTCCLAGLVGRGRGPGEVVCRISPKCFMSRGRRKGGCLLFCRRFPFSGTGMRCF